jgi:hypothetical protein
VSYSYELAADARPDFQGLEVQLQEQALDAIEQFIEGLPEGETAFEEILEI